MKREERRRGVKIGAEKKQKEKRKKIGEEKRRERRESLGKR